MLYTGEAAAPQKVITTCISLRSDVGALSAIFALEMVPVVWV